MSALQAAKDQVWAIWGDLVDQPGPVPLTDGFSATAQARGPAPLGDAVGPQIAPTLFGPIARAFPVAQWVPDLFLAGQWQGEVWVATHGHLVGEQRVPFCRVPAGAGIRRLRLGLFYRVEGGQITGLRMLTDIPALAAQAGYRLLPPFPARADSPPPRNGPALMRGRSASEETATTLGLVEAMLGGCNQLEGDDLASMGMAAFWHDDMTWHGPWGVGSTRGFQEFQDWAQGPSVQSFPDRRGGFHVARIADGQTAAFTGWPSLRGTFAGKPFRGIAPTGGPIGQNIMDFYVRKGSKLWENWVLIDLVEFAAQCGVDLLRELPDED